MRKRQKMQMKSLVLRTLLERHSPVDVDVKEVLETLQPFLDSIDAGLVTKGERFPYRWLFFGGENNLPAFPDICEAAAELAVEFESTEDV